MIWRPRRSPNNAIDAEGERELRLIAQARAGAAWAVSALVARYQPPVVRYLVRLTGDPQHAPELAESIFVRMGRRVRGPHGGQHLRLWLLRAATDMGLDALRHPRRAQPPRLAAPGGPVGLLASRTGAGSGRGQAARASRPAPRTQRFVWQPPDDVSSGEHNANDEGGVTAAPFSPREALRHQLVRAVLAELPYGDAQCLALHLVAGLNQSEVAAALGLAAPVARRRIVQGLQLFGRRYEAAMASLGLPDDLQARAGTGVPPQDGHPSPAASASAEVEATTTGLTLPVTLVPASDAATDDNASPPPRPVPEVATAAATEPAAPVPWVDAPDADVLAGGAPPASPVCGAGAPAPDGDTASGYADAPRMSGAEDDGYDAHAGIWGTWSLYGAGADLGTDTGADSDVETLADTDDVPLYLVDLREAGEAEPAPWPIIEATGAAHTGEGSGDEPLGWADSALEHDRPWIESKEPAPAAGWNGAAPADRIEAATMPPPVAASEAVSGGASHVEHFDQYLLVVEAESRATTTPIDLRLPAALAWEARRARVLAADGEAEDTVDVPLLWPA